MLTSTSAPSDRVAVVRIGDLCLPPTCAATASTTSQAAGTILRRANQEAYSFDGMCLRFRPAALFVLDLSGHRSSRQHSVSGPCDWLIACQTKGAYSSALDRSPAESFRAALGVQALRQSCAFEGGRWRSSSWRIVSSWSEGSACCGERQRGHQHSFQPCRPQVLQSRRSAVMCLVEVTPVVATKAIACALVTGVRMMEASCAGGAGRCVTTPKSAQRSTSTHCLT